MRPSGKQEPGSMGLGALLAAVALSELGRWVLKVTDE
jgi:hypothetical protein